MALRTGLADSVNLVCAKAAQVAGDLGLKSLIPDLVACFDRSFKNHGEADPQCWAKNAAAKALAGLGHDEAATFLRGCRYVQMESVWRGKTDTAVTLRSLCTLALVQCADLPRAAKLRHLVASMTDREETVRIDAIRAIEQMDGEEAALLLRLKAGIGDPRAAVIGQALESLLRVEGEPALDFARSFLRERERETVRELNSTEEEVVEEAALALGASRLPAAVEALKEAWRREPKIVFLQAVSASRQENGFEFLLDLVRNARERDAVGAVEALALHRDSPEVRAAVEVTVKERGGVELRDRFRAKFSHC
jgi:HEAT repeat protein